jgi:tyrosyl-tRNA synthetase
MSEIAAWNSECQNGANPRDYKFKLAQEIIARFHDEAAAIKALENFEARFQRGAIPDDIDEVTLNVVGTSIGIAHVLKEANLTSSTSEAIRMINQGAVKMDSEKVENPKLDIDVNTTHVYQVGKRKFARISIVN